MVKELAPLAPTALTAPVEHASLAPDRAVPRPTAPSVAEVSPTPAAAELLSDRTAAPAALGSN
jgi:hypothetical protein